MRKLPLLLCARGLDENFSSDEAYVEQRDSWVSYFDVKRTILIGSLQYTFLLLHFDVEKALLYSTEPLIISIKESYRVVAFACENSFVLMVEKLNKYLRAGQVARFMRNVWTVSGFIVFNWLILPVSICLYQRLSHACLSTARWGNLPGETADGSLNQLWSKWATVSLFG